MSHKTQKLVQHTSYLQNTLNLSKEVKNFLLVYI